MKKDSAYKQIAHGIKFSAASQRNAPTRNAPYISVQRYTVM